MKYKDLATTINIVLIIIIILFIIIMIAIKPVEEPLKIDVINDEYVEKSDKINRDSVDSSIARINNFLRK